MTGCCRCTAVSRRDWSGHRRRDDGRRRGQVLRRRDVVADGRDVVEERGDERRRADRVRVADDADVAPRARHGHVQAPLVREEAHDSMRVRPRERQHDGVALASLIPVHGLAVDRWREHGS